MRKFRVKVDREKCIGCGSCVSTCPSNFYFKEGKADVKKEVISESEYDCNLEASELCPVGAISVEEIKEGKEKKEETKKLKKK
ncbi:MAG: ferredoxin [Candidatus Pacearchaeota archaeon]